MRIQQRSMFDEEGTEMMGTLFPVDHDDKRSFR